jgi:hypothetical protein
MIMIEERLTDPDHLDRDRLDRMVANGVRPILQFSGPETSDAVLDEVNALCAQHGDSVDVRFYGFYSSSFDCRTLRSLPAVSSLLLDCLQHAEHIEELFALKNLKALSLGIHHLDMPSILASPAFKRLERLSVGPTKRGNISLAPLAEMTQLRKLHVSQETEIEALGECAQLRSLQLGSIGRSVRLGFVNRLEKLESLRLLLGGRDDIREIQHAGLRELEIVRVKGFSGVEPAAFPNLQKLLIEDQIRLTGLAFTERSGRLTLLCLINCKKLEHLHGLARLQALRELRISRSALDFDALLKGGLPEHLTVFFFYSGKRNSDAIIRQRLNGLGYRESDASAT